MLKLWMLRLVIINCPTVSHLDIPRRPQSKINVNLSKERLIIELCFAQSPIWNQMCLLPNTEGLQRSSSIQVSFKKNAEKFLSRLCSVKCPRGKVIVILTHVFLPSCQLDPWNSQINPSPSLRHSKCAKCSSVTKNYTSGNSACYL